MCAHPLNEGSSGYFALPMSLYGGEAHLVLHVYAYTYLAWHFLHCWDTFHAVVSR